MAPCWSDETRRRYEESTEHSQPWRKPLGGRRLSGPHRVQLPGSGSGVDSVLAAGPCRTSRFRADCGGAGRRLAPAPRLRNGHRGLRRRGRSRGQRRQPGQHRSGRRAMDDGRIGRPAQGTARAGLCAARRPVRDAAALGEPACAVEDDGAEIPDAARAGLPGRQLAGRRRLGARDRRRTRRARRARRGPLRRSTCSMSACPQAIVCNWTCATGIRPRCSS